MSLYEGTFESAAADLAAAIEKGVAESVDGLGRVAVAFSGGVDSSVLVVCAQRHTQVFACSAAAPRARDEEKAVTAAKALGVGLISSTLMPEKVEAELREMQLSFEPTLMDRSLWCLYSVVSRSAAEAGAEAILLGQLSDELFGGYAKYQTVMEREGEGAARALMEEDVRGYAERGRARDFDACSRWLSPRLPFGGEGVVRLGLSLPIPYKIRGGERKAVLRRAAVLLGVPEELASAPKKAAQYSSGMQKLLG
ncbi:MAG: asparagine synthase C-terminal domain-containing protein [Thaumarchaeota archaeon]|nr:asparagine synthase C-terminal domain-containing protein [Nitrososphaerota archaeon]